MNGARTGCLSVSPAENGRWGVKGECKESDGKRHPALWFGGLNSRTCLHIKSHLIYATRFVEGHAAKRRRRKLSLLSRPEILLSKSNSDRKSHG